MTKSAARKLLNSFGYDIKIKKLSRKNKRDINRQGDNPLSAPLVIEFVGPSGIGKTTFLNCIKGELTDSWVFREDLEAINKEYNGHINENVEKVARALIQKKIENILSTDIPLFRNVKRMNRFMRLMMDDAFYCSSRPAHGLFSDGGVLQNLTNEIIELQNWIESDSYAINYIFARNVIFLDADEEYVIENLKKRQLESPNRTNNWISVLGHERIHDYVCNMREQEKKLLEIAESNGANVLRIDATNTFSDNKILILNYANQVLDEARINNS